MLVDTRAASKRFDILSPLVAEALKKHGVAANDPFRAELAERLAEETRRNTSILRPTDLRSVVDAACRLVGMIDPRRLCRRLQLISPQRAGAL